MRSDHPLLYWLPPLLNGDWLLSTGWLRIIIRQGTGRAAPAHPSPPNAGFAVSMHRH